MVGISKFAQDLRESEYSISFFVRFANFEYTQKNYQKVIFLTILTTKNVYDLLFSLASYLVTVRRRCRHSRFDRCQTRNRLSLWSRAFVNLIITKSFSPLLVFYAFFSSDVPIFRLLSLVFAHSFVSTLTPSVSLESALIPVLSGISVHLSATSPLIQ